MPTQRHFPPPWSAEVQPNYYVVRDADGQQLAYIYYSNDPDRQAAAKLLTKDEARRIAANIAKLPTMLRSHELLPKYFKQPKYDEKQAEAEDKPD